MTIQDLKNGTPFMYDNSVYNLEEMNGENWIITRHNMYVASIRTIGTKRIEYFTFVLGKRVSGIINIKDCKEVTE